MGSHGRASPEAGATVVTNQINMQSRDTTVLLVLFLVTVLARVTQSSCPFEGKEICEGAVTRELSTVVKICQNGKLRLEESVSGMERSSATEPLLKICIGGGSSLNAARE